MSKSDFDNYIKALSITVREDMEALTKIKEAHAMGETDEYMVKAAEEALYDDQYKLKIFLFAKGLMDKPTRKKKWKVWHSQNKLPKIMPIREKNE